MRQMILCLGDQTMHSMFSQELRLLSILLVAKMIGILISPIIKTHFILWVKLVVRFCQLLAPSSTWDLDVDEASSATVNQLTIISICLREQRRILEHEYYLNHQQQNPFCHCCNSIDWWKQFMTGFFFLFHTLLSVSRCQPYAKREKLAFWCLRYRSLGYWGFVRWSNPTLVQFTEGKSCVDVLRRDYRSSITNCESIQRLFLFEYYLFWPDTEPEYILPMKQLAKRGSPAFFCFERKQERKKK